MKAVLFLSCVSFNRVTNGFIFFANSNISSCTLVKFIGAYVRFGSVIVISDLNFIKINLNAVCFDIRILAKILCTTILYTTHYTLLCKAACNLPFYLYNWNWETQQNKPKILLMGRDAWPICWILIATLTSQHCLNPNITFFSLCNNGRISYRRRRRKAGQTRGRSCIDIRSSISEVCRCHCRVGSSRIRSYVSSLIHSNFKLIQVNLKNHQYKIFELKGLNFEYLNN